MADFVPSWGGASFEPASSSVGGFVPDTSFEPSFGGGFVPDMSFDAPRTAGQSGDSSFEAGGDGQEEAAEYSGCKFCKSLQHKGRECPDRPDDFGKCFTCGGDHMKADCPNKPPPVCKVCRQEGHEMTECNANRLLEAYGVTSELTDIEAWDALVAADASRDLDDIKTATFAYAKAAPGTTVEELEEAFRRHDMNTHLIAKEQTVSVTHTLVNFQGKPDQKFVTTFQFSAKPRRLRQDEGWPSSSEENIERLGESGFVLDSMVTVCRNCGETGHTARACQQDKVEIERVEIKCSLCDVVGHRARDCNAPRRKPGKARECRICNSTEHIAADCTEKPVKACRNCDSTEHEAKECDQPKDWSRVTCKNCGEKGHGVKRCKMPLREEADGGDGFGGDGFGGDVATEEVDTANAADTGGW